mmetsp:Transcript_10656/g.25646  ORF Transcript_10656/g.25646 Transcript_10656/m.25646 type:complete len:754 (-) Transcript_10656:272-2533(-)
MIKAPTGDIGYGTRLSRSNVQRQSSDDERIGESTRDNRHKTDITSVMLVTDYCADVLDDDKDCSDGDAKRERVKRGGNNKNTNVNKINESEIRIPAAMASQRYTQHLDKTWARELSKIGRKKREAILEELHCVRSRAVPETQETIQSGLMAMELEISKIVTSSPTSEETKKLLEGHLLATEILQSKYVVAPEFRLRFLRTEFFDASKAALRYFTNLNYMHKYYGESALLRSLELSDLSANQRRCLERGRFQILLNRDRMGRRILLLLGAKAREKSYADQRFVEDYLRELLAQDEETQLHGACHVVIFHRFGGQNSDDNDEDEISDSRANIYDEGVVSEPERQQLKECDDHNEPYSSNTMKDDLDWGRSEKKILKKLFQFGWEIPLLYAERKGGVSFRWSSIHFCFPNNRVYNFFKAVVQVLIPSKYWSMTKVHVGSLLECTCKMAQFGIPAEVLGTTMKSKAIAKFLRARASVESFRKNVRAKRGVEHYQPSSELKGVQQQDLEQERVSNDGYIEDDTTYQNSQVPVKTESGAVEVTDEPDFGHLKEVFCPGTDCPPSNCVIFGDRITYKYPANVAFREYIREFFWTRIEAEDNKSCDNRNKPTASLRLKVEVLDEIIEGTRFVPQATDSIASANNARANIGNFAPSSKRFMFAIYDKDNGWYRYMFPFQNANDRIELRKRISQTVRDDRKRTMKKNSNRTDSDPIPPTSAFSTFSTALCNTDGSRQVLDAKRLKTNHSHWYDFFDSYSGDCG